MGNNNAEVIFQTRIRSSDDRRRVGGRRLFREQEYIDHNPERRVNKIERRSLKDRREWLPDTSDAF